MRKITLITPFVLILSLVAGSCATNRQYIGRSKIENNKFNREIVKAIEDYRLAVVRKDVPALILMASNKYWEDRGSIAGHDDYTRKQLPQELATFFSLARDIRFDLKYEKIKNECPDGKQGGRKCRVFVEVQIDASFTMDDALGRPMRADKLDQNRLVLVWENESWKFEEGY